MVVQYLERLDPRLAQVTRVAYRCFQPYNESPESYARAPAFVPTSCGDGAVAL